MGSCRVRSWGASESPYPERPRQRFRAYLSTMKGFQAISGPLGPTEGSLEGLDLSLMGLPPPVSQRPNSTSATKPITCSISAVMGSKSRRKAQEATGPGASGANNNLCRSNSTTQIHQPQAKQAWTGPLRLAKPPDFLRLFEGNLGWKKKPASLSKTSSKKGATWNILDDQPRAITLLPNTQSPSTVDALVGPWRRECTVPLAPNFTANNSRSTKAAVSNCTTTMVPNRYASVDTASPKSSNHAVPSHNNLIKAATDEGEGSSFRNPQKNCADSNHVARNNSGTAEGLLRWREVTEEEAERFIHQVNQAAITIQRWYRHQSQQHQARATSLEHLLASKQEGEQQRLEEGNLLDLHKHREAARKKAREEKARQARQTAIQELQQKRTQKSGDAKPELLKGTRETRKPRPAQETPLRPGDSVHQTHKANNIKASFHAIGPEDPCQPVPNSSPEPQQFPEDKPQDASSQDMAGEALERVGPGGSRSKCKATLDELLDTLKLLEEEPEPLPCPRAYHRDRYTWTNKEDDASCLTADNLEKFGKFSTSTGPPEDRTLLSEAKLQSIMSFLDEMEKSGQDRPASAPQGLMLEEGPGRLESTSEVSTCMMRLKLEVEEKKQALVLLQRVHQQDLTVRRVKETEKELCQQLWQQREHYEATIQRHLSFINQLIEDKKTLGEKCEALVAKLKQGDQRCKEREAQIQEQHELEIKKLKELMSATEKVGREKWMKEKTRRIKEITVRGLEPEIQKLIAKHKQEVKSLRSLHTAELLQADKQAAQHYGRQAEALREQLEQEKEALVQQEHEHAQRRFEQQLEREQWDLQQLRQRLYSEVAEEKERLGQQAARQRAELEELRQQLEESSSARGQALRAELEKKREELEHRHQMELQALKDQVQVERQMWETSCAKKEEVWLLNRERELREEIQRGRDKDIELIICQLEANMTLAREESERATESRIKHIRDKYEVELLELEQSEQKLQDQCAELKGRLAEAEGENACLQALMRQKDKALAEVKTMNEQLTSERSNLAQVLHQEFTDQLAASEEGNLKVRVELAELQACQQLELEQLRREKQAELEDVHRRVKLALAKKEEAINSLRKQHEAVVKRADHLEELLEQRRQPLLSAK
ncbi:centrosomal protein of 131 kDa isoform X2 [Saccopteryx bilineata]|uniref:centrosomal protein of 131 kDa isoform X2 n=1 Tax=Saccopteryx bilineata TaxID=59482 RepID=UPI0033900DCD